MTIVENEDCIRVLLIFLLHHYYSTGEGVLLVHIHLDFPEMATPFLEVAVIRVGAYWGKILLVLEVSIVRIEAYWDNIGAPF